MSKFIRTQKALSPWIKIAATGGILLGTAAIIGSGAFAVWTSSSTATASVSDGSIKLTMVGSTVALKGMTPGDTVQQLLTISFPQTTDTGNQVTAIKFSVAPGTEVLGTNTSTSSSTAGYNDSTGSSLFSGSVASLTPNVTYADGTQSVTAAAGSSALVYTINTCTVPWAKVGSNPYYSCSGTTTSTAGSSTANLNAITSTSPLTLSPANFDSTAATASQTPFAAVSGLVTLNTMLSVTLPRSANNSFIGASIPLSFTASIVQRDGTVTGS